MPSVDDRIVRMEFDNVAFEKKIRTTLDSLAQLDKALKFTGATKGLSDVSTAAEKVNFMPMGNAIEDISKKFIALSTIAITALSNITSHALQAASRVVKAFSLQPIIEGFGEYETQLNSVQTILANTVSKGTTLDQVSEALQRLNTYSDQTIYNFGQMARNIGTFTAAGVDLETSVQSIKGIANLAAMSGSTSEQAATAMYQLSQAIAAGSLKLMDWNSVVNAGMGGEAFKTALFETQKVMGNVLNVPVGQTFTEWEDAGNSFRESLQDGWITADVLTTTLETFTGDMTKEMLLAKGFSELQAENIMKIAATAKAAATEVKTFTQLMQTTKEAVATGWADTFKIIIGNFTEAKELWTGVSNTINGFVGRLNDARNEMLQQWKDFGGRTDLIEGLKAGFHALGEVLRVVKEAFTNIFPPVTAANLIRLTFHFKEFMQALTPTAETLEKIKSIASGFFAVLGIGWEVIKEGTKFIAGLVKELLGIPATGVTNFAAKLGDGLTALHSALVKGGGIKAFFETLRDVLEKPLALLQKVQKAIGSVFDLFDSSTSDKVVDGMGRVTDRFKSFKEIFEKAGELWKPFQNALIKITEILAKVWDVISGFFKEIGDKLADVMGKGSFDKALDALNVGLLGGIVLLLRKFIKEGLSIDLSGGLFDKIGKSFDQLTSTLSAMQTSIKANALMKIAGAIAILTASVVTLSLIDSAALTKALGAMAVGFGELMASFTVLSKLASTPAAAASFGIISTGLIALSTAILIMSAAVKVFSTMSWEELAKGLAGIGAAVGILVGASILLAKYSASMIGAAIGLTALSIALTILGGAMKIFATMSWEEIGKGLAAVAGLLLAIGTAMNLIPPSAILIGPGILAVAVALNILAGAVKIFSKMSWEDIGKGMAGIGGGLLAIALALNLMPPATPLIAAGLVLVGIALNGIAAAMKIFSTMSWDEIGRGLTAMAGALLVLAVGVTAMALALPGAVALTIITPALAALFAVLKTFGTISFGDLLKSLAKLAIVLGGLALAASLIQPAIPAILSLGIALIALGVGFALIGGGAILVGKALEIVAKSGAKAAKVIPELLKAVGEAIPALSIGLAKALVEMTKVFLKAAPIFAKMIGKLLTIILQKLDELIPLAIPVIEKLIVAILTAIRTYADQYIQTGFFIITKLLQGIRDNIDPIVNLAADIITNFLEAMQREIPRIAAELADTLIVAFTETARQVGEVSATILPTVGKAFIEGFFTGVKEGWGPVADWFLNLGGTIVGLIGDATKWLLQKGKDILQGLLNGIVDMWSIVKGWFTTLGDSISGLIKNPIDILWDVGIKILKGLLKGMQEAWEDAKDWLTGLPGKIVDLKGPPRKDAVLLYDNGLLIMQGLRDGMQKEWKNTEKWLNNIEFSKNMTSIIGGLADQLSDMEEFSPIITPVLDLTRVASDASKIGGYINTTPTLAPTFSLDQARTIAHNATAHQEFLNAQAQQPVSTAPMFEQNIYAPTELSTSDIYKQTRNQITMAKEELSIP